MELLFTSTDDVTIEVRSVESEHLGVQLKVIRENNINFIHSYRKNHGHGIRPLEYRTLPIIPYSSIVTDLHCIGSGMLISLVKPLLDDSKHSSVLLSDNV